MVVQSARGGVVRGDLLWAQGGRYRGGGPVSADHGDLLGDLRLEAAHKIGTCFNEANLVNFFVAAQVSI